MKRIIFLGVVLALTQACAKPIVINSLDWRPTVREKMPWTLAVNDKSFQRDVFDKKRDSFPPGRSYGYGGFTPAAFGDLKKAYESVFAKVIVCRSVEEAVAQGADYYLIATFDWLAVDKRSGYPSSVRVQLRYGMELFDPENPEPFYQGGELMGVKRLRPDSVVATARTLVEHSVASFDGNKLFADYPANKKKLQESARKGDAAAAAGRTIEALAYYKKALGFELIDRGDAAFDDLMFYGNPVRAKYAKLIGKQAERPAVPESAKRQMVRGQVKFKEKKFSKAAIAMRKAMNTAPWWAEAYHNIALVYEAWAKDSEYKREKHRKLAAMYFQFYALAAPQAEDAEKARLKSYELEAMDD